MVRSQSGKLKLRAALCLVRREVRGLTSESTPTTIPSSVRVHIFFLNRTIPLPLLLCSHGSPYACKNNIVIDQNLKQLHLRKYETQLYVWNFPGKKRPFWTRQICHYGPVRSPSCWKSILGQFTYQFFRPYQGEAWFLTSPISTRLVLIHSSRIEIVVRYAVDRPNVRCAGDLPVLIWSCNELRLYTYWSSESLERRTSVFVWRTRLALFPSIYCWGPPSRLY